jgi:ribosomal 50S subunit-recycling heat shock protein
MDHELRIMRLDKFLKASRIIKRRPIAKAVCDSGRVRVNDHPAKAGKELHEGDVLRIDLKSSILTCQILSIPTGNIRAAEASSLYKIISEEKVEC